MKKKVILEVALIFVVLILICCSKKISPEERALKLARDSHALGGDISVEDNIRNWLKKKKDEVRPLGWAVKKEADKVYLVSYRYEIHSFTEGIGERGYFFEVNLTTKIVRNVTTEFLQKMKPLSPPLKSEKEIMEETLKESDFLKKIE